MYYLLLPKVVFVLACDECTQMLFDEIAKMSESLKNSSVLFENYSTLPWTLLENKIVTYEKLNDKFVATKRNVEEVLKNPKIFNLGGKVEEIRDKTSEANKMAENNFGITEKLSDKSNDVIMQSEDIQRDLIKLLKDINEFGNSNVSVEDALKKALKTHHEIQDISNAIMSLEDSKIYKLCSDIKERIKTVYTNPSGIPYKRLEDIEKMLEDIMDTNTHIETDLDLANYINIKNSQNIDQLKKYINNLNEKKHSLTNNVKTILKKIDVINDVMDQLETVYQDLLDISRSGELNDLTGRIRRQISKVDVQEKLAKSIEHVQELENKVSEYKK